MKTKKLSLSDRIALAASGAQEDEYPEDIEYETSARVVDADSDDDQNLGGPRSTLRAKNVQLLDEVDKRYYGEKVSRKQLAKSTEKNQQNPAYFKNDTISDEESDDKGDNLQDSCDGSGSDEDEGYDQNEDSEGNNYSFGDGDEESASEDGSSSEIQALSIRDKELEVEKGKATLNQIRMWDSLLEARIRLQKMLIDCNRLPTSDDLQELKKYIMTDSGDSKTNLSTSLQKSQEAVQVLLYELNRLQKIMIEKNCETKNAVMFHLVEKDTSEETSSRNESISENIPNEDITKRKRKNQVAVYSENAKKMKPEDFLSMSNEAFVQFKQYRNQIIQKWNDKTQFAGGKYNKKSSSRHISTLKQIEQILANKDRLLKRTQIKRCKYSVIGKLETRADEINGEDDNECVDPEIFDDDDFYHQLLRELIERKTANVNDPIQLSHHWMELQKLRNKLKKKVDTKASKGRKIRYDVHSKLVSFMAPQDNCSMSGTAVKELFGSLFGKTKS